MALKKTFNINVPFSSNVEGWKITKDSENVSLVDCYIKVEEISGNKNNVRFNVSLRSNNAVKHESYHFEPQMNGDNFIKQCYQYLKTLDKFSGATDC